MNKIEVKRFEVLTDSIIIQMTVNDRRPWFFLEYNNEKIGSGSRTYSDVLNQWSLLRTMLIRQNNMEFCDWCSEPKVDVQKYVVKDEADDPDHLAYTQQLCNECLSRHADKVFDSIEVVENA